MNKQSFTIGCLSLSAVMLIVGIVVLGAFETRTAEAGMITTAGRYTMLTGRLQTAEEMVYIVDSQANTLLVYRLNPATANILLSHRQSLEEGTAPKPPGKKMRP